MAENLKSYLKQIDASEYKSAPGKLLFEALADNEFAEQCDLAHDFLPKELSSKLGWAGSKSDQFKDKLIRICGQRVKTHPLVILDEDSLLNLIKSDPEKRKVWEKTWGRFYWNEIDQYIYVYRSEILNLLSNRMSLALTMQKDHITLAMLTRQVLEIAFAACANQYVLLHSSYLLFNAVQSDELGKLGTLEWDDLHQYVRSLTCWSKKQRKRLKEFVNHEKLVDLPSNYLELTYKPDMYRQYRLVAQFAKQFKQNPPSKEVEAAWKDYSFLSRFVHPNPENFGGREHDESLTTKDIQDAVHLCAIRIFDSIHELLVRCFMHPHCDELKFYPIIEQFVHLPAGRGVESLSESFLPSIMETGKKIVVNNDLGSFVICEARPSHRANKIARDFDSLNDSNQAEVKQLIEKLKTGQRDIENRLD